MEQAHQDAAAASGAAEQQGTSLQAQVLDLQQQLADLGQAAGAAQEAALATLGVRTPGAVCLQVALKGLVVV